MERIPIKKKKKKKKKTCSAPDYLQEELDHIIYILEKFNNYPKWAIKQLLEEVKYNHHRTSHEVLQINEVNNDEESHLLLLPYSGPKGEKPIRSMKKQTTKAN